MLGLSFWLDDFTIKCPRDVGSTRENILTPNTRLRVRAWNKTDFRVFWTSVNVAGHALAVK